ncbi:MAG: hypothetical protein JW395_1716 [Nitrospira sp.]|nr:hypothetical protein [Nitrospira sp.]
MSKNTSRTLTTQLLDAFEQGHLTALLRVIQVDHTLSLEFRGAKAIAYYRGGKLLEIQAGEDGVLQCKGPTKGYLKNKHFRVISGSLALPDQIATDTLIELIPQWKCRMDCSKKLKLEIEFTQLLARENNWDLRNSDYIICDLEYAERISQNKSARFDAVGLGWPAGSVPVRSNGNPRTLVLVEAKYGLNAIGGSNAAKAKHDDMFGHFQSALEFCCDLDKVNALRQQVLEVFNQKLTLGLLNTKKVRCERLNCFATSEKAAPLELLYVLGGCSPKSNRVTLQLSRITEKLNAESRIKTEAGWLQVNIATGGLMGYGLFSRNVYGIQEFFKKCAVRS